jgi:hypothetical protein
LLHFHAYILSLEKDFELRAVSGLQFNLASCLCTNPTGLRLAIARVRYPNFNAS